MENYVEMRLRPDGEIIRVYSMVYDGNCASAIIFVPSMHMKMNNGWQKVKMSKLVPLDIPLNGSEMTSNTKRAKAKKRLKMIDATWETSDGERWSHEIIGAAIEHELKLMELELEKKEETVVAE